jgi:hypothetical protein
VENSEIQASDILVYESVRRRIELQNNPQVFIRRSLQILIRKRRVLLMEMEEKDLLDTSSSYGGKEKSTKSKLQVKSKKIVHECHKGPQAHERFKSTVKTIIFVLRSEMESREREYQKGMVLKPKRGSKSKTSLRLPATMTSMSRYKGLDG